MKQPELGKKLAEFRNKSGLTQEQLSEKTKINIRTIQRIELGEVTPRSYTLQIIVEALGRDFSEVNGDREHFSVDRPEILKVAAVAGIAGAINTIILLITIVLRDVYGIRPVIHIIAIVYIISILLTVLLNRGIIRLGKIFNNQYLVITGFAGIFLTLFCNIAQITWLYDTTLMVKIIAKIFLVMTAVNGIFYGVGLLILKRYLNDLALIAGSLMIFGSVLLIIPVGMAELAGLVILIPFLLLQSLIFYRVLNQ